MSTNDNAEIDSTINDTDEQVDDSSNDVSTTNDEPDVPQS